MIWYVISILLAVGLFWAGIRLYLWGKENFSGEAKQRHIEAHTTEARTQRENLQKERDKILMSSFAFEADKVRETNPDGTARQDILRRVKRLQEENPPSKKHPERGYIPLVSIETHSFPQGGMEMQVLLDGKQVGKVPLESCYQMGLMDCRQYEAVPTFFTAVDEESRESYLGLKVTITYRRFSYELSEEEQDALRKLGEGVSECE